MGERTIKWRWIPALMNVIRLGIAFTIFLVLMSQFAFRTNIPAWIFVVSLLAVVAITLAVVTLQSWRAANANPVDSLKNE